MPPGEHPELDGLADAFELVEQSGRPLVVRVDRPLHPANQRLADFFGVRVVVTSQVISGRQMGHYIEPAPSFKKDDGPRADWIDYRASVARVFKREQAGDEAVTCSRCGTETDVTSVVHSPNCAALSEPDGLDLLERMDRGEPLPRPTPSERIDVIECKIDGCERDASDAPKAGPTARLCEVHRAERSAEISASRIGRPRSSRAQPPPTVEKPPSQPPAASGGNVSRAERLIEAAKSVDEAEAALAVARSDLDAIVQEFV